MYSPFTSTYPPTCTLIAQIHCTEITEYMQVGKALRDAYRQFIIIPDTMTYNILQPYFTVKTEDTYYKLKELIEKTEIPEQEPDKLSVRLTKDNYINIFPAMKFKIKLFQYEGEGYIQAYNKTTKKILEGKQQIIQLDFSEKSRQIRCLE